MILRTAAVLLGGGSGSRVGADANKVLLPLAGTPVWQWSLHTIRQVSSVAHVVVVARSQDLPALRPRLGKATLVLGGAERHDSEWNALQALAHLVDAGEIDVVAIHDLARPLASPELWTAVVEAAHDVGGAIPVRVIDGVITADGRPVTGVVGVQTPQAFRARELLAAYREADRDGFKGTDTASCVERYSSLRIRAVEAPATNLKITFPEDVALAETLSELGGLT